MIQTLNDLLLQADERRRAGQWQGAQQGYARAQALRPQDPVVAHNLALCHLALGQYEQAIEHARRAVALAPGQLVSAVLLAKALAGGGRREEALPVLEDLHRRGPQQPDVRMELAKLCLHQLGDMERARSLVAPLKDHPQHGEDARLTELISCLYDRPEGMSAEALSQNLMRFAQEHLHLPPTSDSSEVDHEHSVSPVIGPTSARGRLRVGLLSPQFCVSPVYFFTIGALKVLARQADLVFFHRGSKEDWATAEFRSVASQWHAVQALDAAGLEKSLRAQQLDTLIDLGGWMDPVGLKALSLKPARRMYKWVGGQSATTGLGMFDGFISDRWQSPVGSESHYSEPLLRLKSGYVTYTPPPYMPHAKVAPVRTPALVLGVISNPAKVSAAFLKDLVRRWPQWQAARAKAGLGPIRLRLIEQRYALPAVRARIEQALSGVPHEFVVPAKGHADYLRAVQELDAVVDTWPYSGGLTTIEAMALGVPIYTRGGELFCERHTLSHAKYAGLLLRDVSLEHFDGIHLQPSPAPALQGSARLVHEALGRELWNLVSRAEAA